MSSAVTADVRLHGTQVGVLTYDRGRSSFEYQDDLLSPAHRVLGQVFEDDPRTIRRVPVGLPAWFANLLPEGELRRQVIRGMGGGNVGDFRLLVRLGRDLPGAVTVESEVEPDDAEDVTGQRGLPESVDHQLRYSLAGVQLKYSVHSSRLTIPTSGEGGWWVVKSPDRGLPCLAENEYLTMGWLAAAGVETPRVELLPASAVAGLPSEFIRPDEALYVVERFDRSGAGRIHYEDFAQVADVDPIHKYAESGATYATLGKVVHLLAGEAGFRDFLERLVAMVITGNTDAHLKNWAIWYPDGRTPDLSPVYDFHSLTIYRPYRYSPLALSLAGEVMPNLVGHDHFRRLAEASGVDPDRAADVVRETIDRLRATWDGKVRHEARRLFEPLAEHYERRLRELPITRS